MDLMREKTEAEKVKVIEAKDLVVSYGNRTALQGVSVSAVEGAVLGLLGPNGAGKSTFVRACLGLLCPAAGTIRVLGLDPVAHGERVRRRIGFVLEKTGLSEALDCRSNLRFHGEMYRVEPGRLRARIDELLERFGLADRARDPVASLSKGLKQRLALARALLHRPKLILLDEPTSGLDPAAAREVRGLIASVVRDDATTVLLTTHNMVEAERLCDTVVILCQGRVVRQLDARELTGVAGVRVRCRPMSPARAEAIVQLTGAAELHQTEKVTEFVFDPATEPEEARRAVADGGGDVLEVVRGAGGLEEAYLSATGRSGP
ncbi:MAG TPA: hypothetical protein DGR79_07840 [Clostridiales bacterium]|nr:hypothetical protein [Clostridiales bacterium]